MSEDVDLRAYFERIAFAGSIAPDLGTLTALCEAHPAAIPFENLAPLMGEPVRLELLNLQQKLLFDRRGGFCLEQNLLFRGVLETLGYEVRTFAARVLWGHGAEAERPASHLVLAASWGGAPYLADVGFGAVTLTAPLRLRADVEQQTPHEIFRLVGGDPVWRLEVKLGEDWKPVYQFEEIERTAEEISAINDFVSADPLFRESLIAARTGRGQRLTLQNLRFRTHRPGAETETRWLRTAAELRDALAGPFGIALPPAEKLEAALEGVVACNLVTLPPEAA